MTYLGILDGMMLRDTISHQK